mmetsp:Transcript_13152/g.24254  ORF Transcript_13152/g.24254 Transcript_13152/m.24254 type:complete len:203 (+) Transcript_13152:236-844(+)
MALGFFRAAAISPLSLVPSTSRCLCDCIISLITSVGNSLAFLSSLFFASSSSSSSSSPSKITPSFPTGTKSGLGGNAAGLGAIDCRRFGLMIVGVSTAVSVLVSVSVSVLVSVSVISGRGVGRGTFAAEAFLMMSKSGRAEGRRITEFRLLDAVATEVVTSIFETDSMTSSTVPSVSFTSVFSSDSSSFFSPRHTGLSQLLS